MKIYRANIIYTPTPDKLAIIPHGYIVVKSNGQVEGIYTELPENMDWRRQVMDFGDKILIPAFNDLHVHAPQYRNMGLALDLELLPWLNTYTFPEESKYADPEYARRLYRRFVHELWMQGTMRSAVFATIHPEATRILADLFIQAGMGAYVGLVGMNRNSPDTLQIRPDLHKGYHRRYPVYFLAFQEVSHSAFAAHHLIQEHLQLPEYRYC